MNEGKLRGKIHLAIKDEVRDLDFKEQAVIVDAVTHKVKEVVFEAKRKAVKKPLFLKRRE